LFGGSAGASASTTEAPSNDTGTCPSTTSPLERARSSDIVRFCCTLKSVPAGFGCTGSVNEGTGINGATGLAGPAGFGSTGSVNEGTGINGATGLALNVGSCGKCISTGGTNGLAGALMLEVSESGADVV